MEYLRIHESIAVAGVYQQGKFSPTAFQWQGRKWVIGQTTQVINETDGGVLLRHYSVIANQQLCRLIFDRRREVWWLEEVWDEPMAAR